MKKDDLVEERVKELDPIQRWEEWSYQDLYNWFSDVSQELVKAEKTHSNVRLTIQSTVEPYEQYPGVVEVEIWGERPLNEQEIQLRLERQEIQKLAQQLGCSYSDAATVQRLKKQGKL